VLLKAVSLQPFCFRFVDRAGRASVDLFHKNFCFKIPWDGG